MRILVVEDEPRLAEHLEAALRQAGRFVASFQARIGSRDGRFVIRPEVREALLAAAHPIRVGLKGLRSALSSAMSTALRQSLKVPVPAHLSAW